MLIQRTIRIYVAVAIAALVLVSGCESKKTVEENMRLKQQITDLMQEVQDIKEDRDALEADADRLANENSALIAVIEVGKVITQVAEESPEKTIVATRTGVRVVQKSSVDDRIQKKLALEHGKSIEGGYHRVFHKVAAELGGVRMQEEFMKFCKSMKKKEADCP
ncbi:MAG: hypothetical protein KAR83_08730 [Thermodesulfovibrionales bacterium]|nr:hypothetical protein [Thermodesulfovibrionales bacterium]